MPFRASLSLRAARRRPSFRFAPRPDHAGLMSEIPDPAVLRWAIAAADRTAVAEASAFTTHPARPTGTFRLHMIGCCRHDPQGFVLKVAVSGWIGPSMVAPLILRIS